MSLISDFFNSAEFMPHGHCYLWYPQILWMHVVSDALISLAYYSIPLSLIYLARRRGDIPFKKMFYLFGAFILLCGTSHLAEIWVIWHPDYGMEGLIKAATAFVSLPTAVIVWKLMPQILQLKSPAELDELNNHLKKSFAEIETTIAQRTKELENANSLLHDNKLVLESALEAAESGSRAKSNFLANIGREVQAPLDAISSLSSAIYDKKLSQAEHEEALEALKINALLLGNTMNNILDITRIENKDLSLDKSKFDLAELISHVVEDKSVMAKQKGLGISINYSPALPKEFTGDEARIRQVMNHLLINAIKFTDTGHITINITGEAKKSYTDVTIDVIDTGIGISNNFLKTIFDKFTQENNYLTQKYGGSGLGLSICKTLVELMGGEITVSTLQDVGTKFTVKLLLPA